MHDQDYCLVTHEDVCQYYLRSTICSTEIICLCAAASCPHDLNGTHICFQIMSEVISILAIGIAQECLVCLNGGNGQILVELQGNQHIRALDVSWMCLSISVSTGEIWMSTCASVYISMIVSQWRGRSS